MPGSRLTASGSAAADSGKTRHANQNETQARRAAQAYAEGGRLQVLVSPPSFFHEEQFPQRTADHLWSPRTDIYPARIEQTTKLVRENMRICALLTWQDVLRKFGPYPAPMHSILHKPVKVKNDEEWRNSDETTSQEATGSGSRLP